MTTIAELPARLCRQGVVGAIDLPLGDGCDGAAGQRPAHRGDCGTPPPMMRGDRRDRADAVRPRYADLARRADVRDPGCRQMAEVSHRRAGDCGFVDLQLRADRRSGRRCPRSTRFALGSNEYPDRSTTLILQVESLTQGPASSCAAPASTAARSLQASIEPSDLFERLAINATLFPRGIDVVLVADDAVVAMPRTTRLVAQGRLKHVCRGQGRRTRHRERPSPAGA